MIEVDESELDEDDREFLERWANALELPIGVLVLRILEAAIDGDQYIAKRHAMKTEVTFLLSFLR